MTESNLIQAREGAAGTLLMNRPKALNALDQGMIRDFQRALDDWKTDASVRLVVLEGAGGRAFCAGGDVRAVRDAAIAGDRSPVGAFFTEEYAVNEGIANFEKPWVSLIDGVCMGGGIGLAIHNGPRVVTENALLAMPETAIALFPDVGTSHILPRLPGALGAWLALTGARLRGGDCVHAGLATHFVPAAKLPALRAALLEGDAAVVERFAEVPPPASFAAHRTLIDDAFGQASVLAIIAALEAEGGEWALSQVAILRRMSPTSLCVSLELLRRGAAMTLRQCLDEELLLTGSVVHDHPDFREGVRHVLVDKGNPPAAWSPATLEEVDPAAIQAMFSRAA